MSTLNSFKESVDTLVITGILNPLKAWLESKGFTCTLEEMLQALQMQKAEGFVFPLAKQASRVVKRKVPQSTVVLENERCEYIFVKGSLGKKGTRCESRKEDGSKYCDKCTKKTPRKANGQIPTAPNGKSEDSPSFLLQASPISGHTGMFFLTVEEKVYIAKRDGGTLTVLGSCANKDVKTLCELNKEERSILQEKYNQSTASEEAFKEGKKEFSPSAPALSNGTNGSATVTSSRPKSSVTALLNSVKS